MGVEIVTGYTGEAHVTSQQDAVLNASMYGGDRRVIIGAGNNFSYELESNTLIKINDGYALNQGRLMGMSLHDYEELAISTGISDTKRSDLISLRYTKDSTTGVESAELVVIEGTAGDDYTDPDYYDNDMLNDEILVDDLLLYRVNIDGLSVDTIDTLYNGLYLDTGWNETDITCTYNPPAAAAYEEKVGFRCKNGVVELKGKMTFTTEGDLAIPEEYAPNHTITNTKVSYYAATISGTTYNTVIINKLVVNTDGTIDVSRNSVGVNGYDAYSSTPSFDLSGISYFCK